MLSHPTLCMFIFLIYKIHYNSNEVTHVQVIVYGCLQFATH